MNRDEHFDRLFTKYYPPSSKLFWGWHYECVNGKGSDYINKRIDTLMSDYHIKTGYVCTAIRGCHDYIIFWKIRTKMK